MEQERSLTFLVPKTNPSKCQGNKLYRKVLFLSTRYIKKIARVGFHGKAPKGEAAIFTINFALSLTRALLARGTLY